MLKLLTRAAQKRDSAHARTYRAATVRERGPTRLLQQPLGIALCLALSALHLSAQSTQALVSGRVVDSQSGRPLASVTVECRTADTALRATARTDASGYYALPLLSPGLYAVRAALEDYQPQEVHSLELAVAARVDLDFRLRPLRDVWEAGQYRSVFLPGNRAIVTFYGPDVDTSRSASVSRPELASSALQISMSQVVDARQIAAVPLAGRDAYNMLITQPGVTADTTTARSLGLSANGQRPSASNFLLDGLENNNYLVSGPLVSLAPEALQEYRVSTNAFSAEYGRTAGYVANTITRSGTNDWHGLAYFNLKNEALNANDFQSNLRGFPRPAAKGWQPGLWIGGPLLRNRLLLSAWAEHLRSRGKREPGRFGVPSKSFAEIAPGPIARRLLSQFPVSFPNDVPGLVAFATIERPVSVDRTLTGARLDRYWQDGVHRLMGRFTSARLDRPDLSWSPYPDFTSGMTHNANSAALTLAGVLGPNLNYEVRAGGGWDELVLDRRHPEIPSLTSADALFLPGSRVFTAFENASRNWELTGTLFWTRGRHLFTAGGGILSRRLGGILSAGDHGAYAFNSYLDFGRDRPAFFRVPLDRALLPALALPDPYRDYGSRQAFAFAQNSHRVTPRFVLNYGVRYEALGAARNLGATQDALLAPGAGETFAARLASARLEFPSGQQQLYPADRNDWAARLGFSWRPAGSGPVLRGAYGIFYDRLFDNLWQNIRNNNFILPRAFTVEPQQADYLAPVAEALQTYAGRPVVTTFSVLTLFQPELRTPYVQSYFLGAQQRLSDTWSIDLDALGSVSRKLLTTDVVNRSGGPLGPVSYRANQGTASYHALAGVVRYRGSRAQVQASYTWSHTIDNQSELLRNDYFDLNPTRLTAREVRFDVSAFSREFDSSADRASSDFDQRHNLAVFSIIDLPHRWRIAQLAAFRSGFPYTVFAPNTGAILNNRASQVSPVALIDRAGPGGRILLDNTAFARPAASSLGNLGRNAFRAPGFYNIDVSLSRTFALPWLGEQGRVTFRADAYNILNHANLTAPDNVLGEPTFGLARFGRRAPQSGLPILTPADDTGRQIELMLRFSF
jgi:hypothetical protein